MALFEPAIKWLTKLPSTFLAGPPKGVFNPEYLTANKWMKRFNAEWKRAGFGAAYNKARMESTMRKGTFVGKDKNGNSYFEDKTAPYGRTRWVEYPTPPGVWVIEMKYDGSMVRASDGRSSRASHCLAPAPCLRSIRLSHRQPPPFPPRIEPSPGRVAGEPGVARLAALHARQDGA